ncbi:UdgX family uracil-DNA binding protein [Ancylobacter sp. 6x-1]|uniref:Type-4 uracil-DNA glycosylase n=1 Tax=Ancylobacter crimeensis TaxID=2579147 RepID=A0ABT0DC65_9HYPH|nr:UdgX family uracil-DNA binding protein [Ancylobacter crimeensis]MCK0197553.1 UdgX family uracil-DNA binding protein [Ancylobacter crimeensis]
MERVELEGRGDLREWREAARRLLLAGVPPHRVDWSTEPAAPGLFPEEPRPAAAPTAERSAPPTVPARFMEMAEAVICHRDPARFALLYRLLVRLQTERELLAVAPDPDVAAACQLEKAVRRDCHKMTAFVRFHEIGPQEISPRRRFIAWFEPDHHIVVRIAPFFARRFADMDWLILTPKGTAAFCDGTLHTSTEPAEKPALEDPTDALWLTYYASIFNPARLKIEAMRAEMPKKYWKNLPEAALIPELIAGAGGRVAAMAEASDQPAPLFHERLQARQAAPEPGPEVPATLDTLRKQAAGCTRCPLHCQATQTVFGEGPERAPLMVVGEQPGDREDLAGRPFVGPAGQLFDENLQAAGIERARTYVTNAVKHFKNEPRGKRRIHRTPNAGEIRQCRWWLGRELDLVRPKVVVAMGASALFALTDEKPRLADLRGQVLPLGTDRHLLVTVHPAYLLRLPDAGRQAEETRRFRQDLTLAHDWLKKNDE